MRKNGIEDLDRLLKGSTYRASHQRVRDWRGKAKEHPCAHPLCDRTAEQWSYDGHCPFEQEGYVELVGRFETRSVYLRWSPSVYAYTALCIPHHAARDKLQRLEYAAEEKAA